MSSRRPTAASGRRCAGPAPAQWHPWHLIASPGVLTCTSYGDGLRIGGNTGSLEHVLARAGHLHRWRPRRWPFGRPRPAGAPGTARRRQAPRWSRPLGVVSAPTRHSGTAGPPLPTGDMVVSGVAGSHPRGNCARPRGAVLQAVTPVAVRVADAKDASHGDRCHLNGRPHRVDAAAGELHQRSGALGASFRPGSDAGGPSSPWCQHARVTRGRPPSRRQRPPARAAYRLQTQWRQWVALQTDDAPTWAACADRCHSYSTARSLTRCGASMGPESAGLWRRATGHPSTPRADGRRRRPRWPRQPPEPCSCTECSSTSGCRHQPRRLQRGRPPRPERARARAGHSAHAATAAALGPHAHVRCRRRPAQRQRVHGSFVLPRVYSVPRTTYWRSGLAAAPTREPAQENQMKLFVVPTLRPHRRQD